LTWFYIRLFSSSCHIQLPLGRVRTLIEIFSYCCHAEISVKGVADTLTLNTGKQSNPLTADTTIAFNNLYMAASVVVVSTHSVVITRVWLEFPVYGRRALLCHVWCGMEHERAFNHNLLLCSACIHITLCQAEHEDGNRNHLSSENIV
jgi:hypothetical protein